MSKKFLGTLVMVAAIVGASGVAHAADPAVYAGASCHPTLFHHATNTSYPNGNVQNDSDTITADYTCPIDKQQLGFGINGVSVFAIDQSFVENVSCALYYKDALAPNAAGVWYGRSTTGTNSAPQTLSLRGFSLFLDSRVIYSYVSCQLPKRYSGVASRIVAYLVNEETF